MRLFDRLMKRKATNKPLEDYVWSLGSVGFEEYYTSPSDQSPEILGVDNQISKLELFLNTHPGDLGVEKSLSDDAKKEIDKLKIQRKKLELSGLYPELDAEFLSYSSNVKYEGKDIKLPKFGVYNLDYPKFEVEFFSNSFSSSSMVFVCFTPAFGPITDKLSKSLDFYTKPGSCDLSSRGTMHNDCSFTARFPNASRTHRKKYGINRLKFSSEFYGLIPNNTKSNIERVKDDFTKIVLVSEVKPEEWNSKVVGKDVLVMGLYDTNCYFIDQFVPTSLGMHMGLELSLTK